MTEIGDLVNLYNGDLHQENELVEKHTEVLGNGSILGRGLTSVIYVNIALQSLEILRQLD